MQIKKLEETLGVKLLERNNKSVMLTDHGVIIAERARHILSQVDEVREIAKTAKDPFSGEFKLGIIPTLAPYLLPLIMPQLSKQYPKLSFYLIEEQTAQLIEKLKQGKLHAAILALPVEDKTFSGKVLFEEEFLLTVPVKHPLAKLNKIKQQDIVDTNLLLLEEGHCMRDQALALCSTMHMQEAQNFRGTSLETLRHMVSAGVGITLMPKLACLSSSTVVYVPFSQPKPARSLGMFWRTTSSKQVLLEDMVKKLKSLM
jgi:LysR family hydrogen peroxide-inducible transcriptional activator